MPNYHFFHEYDYHVLGTSDFCYKNKDYLGVEHNLDNAIIRKKKTHREKKKGEKSWKNDWEIKCSN
jgi:hypothetical protein